MIGITGSTGVVGKYFKKLKSKKIKFLILKAIL